MMAVAAHEFSGSASRGSGTRNDSSGPGPGREDAVSYSPIAATRNEILVSEGAIPVFPVTLDLEVVRAERRLEVG